MVEAPVPVEAPAAVAAVVLGKPCAVEKLAVHRTGSDFGEHVDKFCVSVCFFRNPAAAKTAWVMMCGSATLFLNL